MIYMSKQDRQNPPPSLGFPDVRAIVDDSWDEVAFWSGYRPWLEDHGYLLYDLTKNYFHDPLWKPSPFSSLSVVLPYVEHSRSPSLDLQHDSWPPVRYIVGFAQDKQGRDVVIKLVNKDSEELSIYEHLLQCTDLFKPDTFACVLPPVDILPSPFSFCFVIMPRWGQYTWVPEFTTVRAVLRCIICVTEGLKFLHEHRIAHRDISTSNVLLNLEEGVSYDSVTQHRNSSSVRYCLFDFNLSSKLPAGADLEECFLPSYKSDDWGHPYFHPHDVEQGEVAYNPFSFDVGCMGNMLITEFRHTIPVIPMLAPLFDRMTTHVISQRFTAAEAHQFCIDIFQSLSKEELDSPVPEKGYNGSWFMSMDEYWANLPQEFLTIWKAYRTPPISLTTRLLRWIGSYYPALRMMRRIRSILHV